MEITVFALGTFTKKSFKENKGKKDVELSIEGLRLKPDDWVYADINGILISDSKLDI